MAKLLHYSGGALNLKKCSWSILFWEWTNGRPKLRTPKPTDAKIRTRSNSSNEDGTEIRMTTPDDANKILVVYLNPVGEFSSHIAYLKKKS
jgi:hypothetical protein